MAIESAHLNTCTAEGEAAGWSGAALAMLVVGPKSATIAGFRANLAEAANIRALVKVVAPSMKDAGYDPDTAAEYFVSKGYSYDTVRTDTAFVLAAASDTANIDTSRKTKSRHDPYASRSKEIDAYNGTTND